MTLVFSTPHSEELVLSVSGTPNGSTATDTLESDFTDNLPELRLDLLLAPSAEEKLFLLLSGTPKGSSLSAAATATAAAATVLSRLFWLEDWDSVPGDPKLWLGEGGALGKGGTHGELWPEASRELCCVPFTASTAEEGAAAASDPESSLAGEEEATLDEG